MLSNEADARTLLSGENATVVTKERWPLSVSFQAPVVASQSRTVLSYEADARTLPSGENATALTELRWPSSVCRQGSQLSLIPVIFFMNDNLCFQCWILTLLLIGLNASAVP